ncbi:hypothetical protein [Arthrobacter mobilis]|uniref:Uncharacterized protein n=1 Tax=Arthrobacter mobilis TaxID=2724944 RepID=A0A7X6HC26_9MICC|nr:hypothetical protein [Arthrobacter mobilis]NKX53745.1 hypothetical protein [Arthrobacter mobilis]
MHQTGGPGWRITADTSGQMLIALYLKDVAGLAGAGTPALCPARPEVRLADPRQLTAHVGGLPALRTQWEQWWSLLLAEDRKTMSALAPPSFPAFADSPALQKLLQAHFGAAMTWARERISDYNLLAQEREANGRDKLIGQLVQDREMELGRGARSFELKLIELPLSEPRAWYVEPDRVLLCQTLLDDEQDFRSYIQPIIELLV